MSGSLDKAAKLAEENEQLRRQVAGLQKLASLGELMSTFAHDLNNILMPVINYAQMGLRHKDEPTREKAFTKILAAGQRAAKLTTGVLSMARGRNTTAFEPTDLARVIEETLLLLERELNSHRVTVERQFEAVPEATACASQIQQVLLNLLVNARQAMPQGGRLLLKLAHDPAAGTVDLTVRDSGQGIEPDKLRRIFDPYFTTKSGPDATGKGGTGLGLASCKEIIEGHKGRIRVESTVGVGTAFTIKLPVAVRAVPAPLSMAVGTPQSSPVTP